MRLFCLVGTQWPNCYLHGWIEQGYQYGLNLLEGLDISYSRSCFSTDTHHVFGYFACPPRCLSRTSLYTAHSHSRSTFPCYPTLRRFPALFLRTVARRRFTSHSTR